MHRATSVTPSISTLLGISDANGVPIPTTFGSTACVQPISCTEVPGKLSTRNGVDGRNVWLVPLIGEISTADPTVVCDPQVDFADYVSEVELERLNLVRTSDAVLWRKLSDVGFRLAEAKANARPITLDGAGRITIDGTPVDAAPEQAAIYASVEGPNPAPPVVEDGRPVGGNRVA